jgi:hypothetical protein
MPLLKNNVTDFCGDFARFGPDRSMESPRFLRSFSSSWGKTQPGTSPPWKDLLDRVAASRYCRWFAT